MYWKGGRAPCPLYTQPHLSLTLWSLHSSREEIFSFSITDWDPCELDRVDDFSLLFLDDTSMDGGCRGIEAMVHRSEEEGDLLEDMDQSGREEGEGGGDNNGGPQGNDPEGEAHLRLHRNVEKQHGTVRGPADQEHGGSIDPEQEHPGILERPVDHGKQESLAQEKGQPATLGEPVGDEEQGNQSMAGGDHTRLQPLTGQALVKEVPLQACRQKEACLLLIYGQQHREVPTPATFPDDVPVGQKIVLPFPEILLLCSCIWWLVTTGFRLYGILTLGLFLSCWISS